MFSQPETGETNKPKSPQSSGFSTLVMQAQEPQSKSPRRNSIHSWEDHGAARLKSQFPEKSSTGTIFSLLKRKTAELISGQSSVSSRRSTEGDTSPLRSQSPLPHRSPPSKSGASSPLSVSSTVRASRGPAKMKQSSVDMVSPGNGFEMGQVVMPLDQALKRVHDIHAAIKVLEKMDTACTGSSILSERRQRAQVRKAEELIGEMNTIFVLDRVERQTFQPLYDRIMAQLVHYLDPNHKPWVECGEAASFKTTSGEQQDGQRVLLNQVALRLQVLRSATDIDEAESRPPCPPEQDSESAEKLDREASMDSVSSLDVDGIILPCTGSARALSEMPSRHGTVLPRNCSARTFFDLDLESVAGTLAPLSASDALNLSSTDVGSESSSERGATAHGTDAVGALKRIGSSTSLLGSDLGSACGTVLPSNGSFRSITSLTKGQSCNEGCLPRNTSQGSLFDALLEVQQRQGEGAARGGAVAPTLKRNNSAESLFEALMAVQKGDDCDSVINAGPQGTLLKV